jgi:benzoyl-CoA reductase/2-hydroxyglutaryl-CoA dehydratase subunit BcrC/BadD/HgdB
MAELLSCNPESGKDDESLSIFLEEFRTFIKEKMGGADSDIESLVRNVREDKELRERWKKFMAREESKDSPD